MAERPDEFVRSTEPFRRELLAHCYRMLGSADEAEDAVQETYLRAWRSYGTFEGRSSVRVWLYRIATNACLTALGQRGRRALPSGLGGPAEDPDAPPSLAEPGTAWLEPVPDALVTPEAEDPGTIVVTREWLRLALIASLQYLPARQRAVLLLREVLGFPAAEVASMLDTSTTAVKSALQRARARLDEVAPAPERIIEPTEPRALELLGQYIAGFENADTTALEKALRADAAIEMVGTRTWFSGRVTCLRYLAHVIGSPGDWRMVPALANGQPAAIAHYRDSAYGLGVLTVTPTGIARITVFGGGPDLAAKFGFPPVRGGLLVDRGAERTRVMGAERLLQFRDGIMEEMPESDVGPGIDAFVAIGDSFTEGLDDPDPGGGFRGWADRVAGALSAQRPGFRYANLAIRGKLLRGVVAEQLPRAVELAPDLVSLAAGGNDILHGSDVDALAAEFEPVVAKLQAAGCRVLIFTGFDPRMFPVIRLLRGRIAAYNMHLRGIADDHGCDLVDLWSMRALKDPRAWSPDRLHLTTEGHRWVALRACEVLGVPVAEDWRAPLPPEPLSPARRVSGPANRAPWLAARRDDARWARDYAAPWVRRRFSGTSSGHGVPPKRPDLLPVS